MLKRTIFRLLTLVVLLVFPVISFADYKVVVKKNGKIIEGKLVTEDESSVTIINQGTRLSFKKKDLDLERMKELNANYQSKSDVKTLDIKNPENIPLQSSETTPLGDVAKQNRDAALSAAQKSAPPPSDSNEKALADWVAELEATNKVIPSYDTEIELSKAKKGLAHYRARAAQKLAVNDRKIMLEQLIKALDFKYRKALERDAPDEELESLKKQIKIKQEELSELGE
jgi:hypothetical protein